MEFENQEMEASAAEERHAIDLNRATAEELDAIPGIGPALAQRIVTYRQTKGAFLAPEEIIAVQGIGPDLYKRISNWLTVTPPETPPPVQELPAMEAAAPEAPPEEVHAEPALEAARPAPAPAGEAAAPREREGAVNLSWLWGALLGALLGIVGMLLILTVINGSINVSHAPAITAMSGRIEALGSDLDKVHAEVLQAQQRLDALEGLPKRMDAVEGTVAELSGTVKELNGEVERLTARVDGLQKNLAAVQERTDRVESFFGRLQSLLAEVFGPQGSSSP